MNNSTTKKSSVERKTTLSTLSGSGGSGLGSSQRLDSMSSTSSTSVTSSSTSSSTSQKQVGQNRAVLRHASLNDAVQHAAAAATTEHFKQSEVSHHESHHHTTEMKKQLKTSTSSSMGGGSGIVAHESHHHHQTTTSSTKKSSIQKWRKTACALTTRRPLTMSSNEVMKIVNAKPLMALEDINHHLDHLEDLERINPNSNMKEVEETLVKYCNVVSSAMETMRNNVNQLEMICKWLSKLNQLVARAWQVPSFGNDLRKVLSKTLQNNGGLDMLIGNFDHHHKDVKYNSAKLFQQCLVTENRGYVVEKSLDKVVDLAKEYTQDPKNVPHSQVGSGILEQLFRHSEGTCSDVIAMVSVLLPT